MGTKSNSRGYGKDIKTIPDRPQLKLSPFCGLTWVGANRLPNKNLNEKKTWT